MRRDEEFEHREAFAEIRANRDLNDLTARVGHEAAHASELTNLRRAAARAGVSHHVDRVKLVQRGHQGLGDTVGRLFPNLDDALSALAVAEHALAEQIVDEYDLLLRVGNHLLLLGGHLNILEADGDAAARGIGKTELLDPVKHLGGGRRTIFAIAAVYDIAKILFRNQLVDFQRKEVFLLAAVHKAEILRNSVVEDHAANRGIHNLAPLFSLPFARQANFHTRLQRDFARLIGHDRLFFGVEDLALALCAGANHGQIVAAHDHILRRRNDRTAILRF
ncbi:hypothetical protein SDC9_134293 [bioreactor metagenome]|uniref:Uncharacterized protein n=1 Tax=bioreactor metagenome TaxID=1076179 RepID=A0A645DD83_9ZZZZ